MKEGKEREKSEDGRRDTREGKIKERRKTKENKTCKARNEEEKTPGN